MPPCLHLRLHRLPLLRPLYLSLRVKHYSTTTVTSTTLINRHALITGASRGIGLAIAQTLASHSCRCTLVSRSPDALHRALQILPVPDTPTHAELRGNYHRVRVGDISAKNYWSDTKFEEQEQEEESMGAGNGGWAGDLPQEKVDILVNAAGVSLVKLLVRNSVEDVQTVMDTNLMGSLLAVRWLLKKKLLRAEKGEGKFSPVVINLASLLAVQGGRGSVAYSASKAGVLGLTRSLAAELGPTGIRVNAIVPGYIETDMTAGMDSDTRFQMLPRIPLGRFGRADEIADAALFLVKNQYANNCVINLDGGLSAT